MNRPHGVALAPAGLGRRVAELAGRYSLASGATGQLEQLARLLDDASAPSALVDLERICEDHLADSLVALELAEVRAATTLADLGSGAGVPGLPLAIALPEAAVSLVESNRRKCEFIRRAVKACRIENTEVVPARAEAWAEGLERFDLVTTRALAPLSVVAEYAAPLLQMGGTLLAWTGRRDHDEEAAAGRAAIALGLELKDVVPVQPYPGAVNRHLQRLVKTAATPARFPRRPGMARKRPLGAAISGPSDRQRR